MKYGATAKVPIPVFPGLSMVHPGHLKMTQFFFKAGFLHRFNDDGGV
jgi:hypothetical protein